MQKKEVWKQGRKYFRRTALMQKKEGVGMEGKKEQEKQGERRGNSREDKGKKEEPKRRADAKERVIIEGRKNSRRVELMQTKKE